MQKCETPSQTSTRQKF